MFESESKRRVMPASPPDPDSRLSHNHMPMGVETHHNDVHTIIMMYILLTTLPPTSCSCLHQTNI